ncbi:MAG: hypothetical protein JZD40_05880 [Sulfolobus sp.]|nr:hypothetical protein [Sulfolobus sp.]
MDKYTIIATIGFTSDFLLRRVFDLGKDSVNEIIPIALETDTDSKTRIEKAFTNIENVLKTVGVNIHPLEFIKIENGIARAREILIRASSDSTVDLFLTGGPRILITITIISALTLPSDLSKRIRITTYGEAFEGKFSINVGTITSFLSLDDLDRKILNTIKNFGSEKVSGLKIVKYLREPKSTVYKKLRDLEEKSLVKSTEKGWKLEDDVKKLL